MKCDNFALLFSLEFEYKALDYSAEQLLSSLSQTELGTHAIIRVTASPRQGRKGTGRVSNNDAVSNDT